MMCIVLIEHGIMRLQCNVPRYCQCMHQTMRVASPFDDIYADIIRSGSRPPFKSPAFRGMLTLPDTCRDGELQVLSTLH